MTAIPSDIYNAINQGGTTSTKKKEDSLGQADFLRLMTEQLKFQDPLKPMDNAQFLGQLAQFSTVQGIGGLQTKLDAFSKSLGSDQLLKGAALVGRNVLVPSKTMPLGTEGNINGVVAAPNAGTVTLQVTDANGQAVRTLTVPADKAGEVSFEWDGKDASGKRLAAGEYSVKATFTGGDVKDKELATYVESKVESVTVGSDGLYLGLAGLGTAPLDYVLRVR